MISFDSLRCRFSFETLRNHIPFAAALAACGRFGMLNGGEMLLEHGEQIMVSAARKHLCHEGATFLQIFDSEPGRRLDQRHSAQMRSEEHTSELQSLMRISYAVFCLT